MNGLNVIVVKGKKTFFIVSLLTCFMSLLRPPPKNFYPEVNMDFADEEI